MSSLSTTYLLPAILLNPAFILHLINTFVSHIMPPPHAISHSPHPFMESLGPLPGSTPYLDVHADDRLCWRYTAIMVIVQMLAFGRVQDNRVERKSARAAKLERERLRHEEKLQAVIAASRFNGRTSSPAAHADEDTHANGRTNGFADTAAMADGAAGLAVDSKLELESEDNSSMTETSEEEMIL